VAGNFARKACPRLGQPAPPAVPAQDDIEEVIHCSQVGSVARTACPAIAHRAIVDGIEEDERDDAVRRRVGLAHAP